jgi:hypothetical protein
VQEGGNDSLDFGTGLFLRRQLADSEEQRQNVGAGHEADEEGCRPVGVGNPQGLAAVLLAQVCGDQLLEFPRAGFPERLTEGRELAGFRHHPL